jgi:lipopolysaccharide/colanic/teichoic acid biosynthesis glycosyltransferase
MSRLIELIVALAIMIVFFPLFLLISLLVKLSSPGPILVKERRAGKALPGTNGASIRDIPAFYMYRFRTVYAFDQTIARLVDKKNITSIGYFLQKTSLDEIPQFINVLRGEMSLIGPRPIRYKDLEKGYNPAYFKRFTVNPGIIGWWQVTRGHLGTLGEMYEADLYYIENRSAWLNIRIFLMTFQALLKRSRVEHWLNQSLDSLRESTAYNFAKRILDIVIAVVVLFFTLPLMLLIALLIRLDSPGPVLFSQMRAGKRVFVFSGNAPLLVATSFRIYKFRTMYHNQNMNDAIHKQWVSDWVSGKLGNGQDPQKVVKPNKDPRVTRVGRFLRATSLDELPQLFNVIKGDMSIVGPRPVPIYETEAYQDEHMHRLDAVPGITGWWQVNLRGRGTLDQMVELDLEYIQKRSLWMDIKIMFLTIPAVIVGRGAK